MRFAALLALLLLPRVARAETDRERAAREVDEQMKELVKLPPATLRVLWLGLDSGEIALDDARFELDDARLSYGELAELDARARSGQPLYDGPVDEGKHTLAVTLIVHRTHVSLFEGLRKTTYKVTTSVNLPGQRGLAVAVQIRLHYDDQLDDVKKRLRLDVTIAPKMVVKVDDAPPPELPHTVIAHAEEAPEPLPPPPLPPPIPEDPKTSPVHVHHASLRVHQVEPAPIDDAGLAPPPDAGPPPPPDAGPAIIATRPPPPPRASPPYGLALAVAAAAFVGVLAFGSWRTRR